MFRIVRLSAAYSIWDRELPSPPVSGIAAVRIDATSKIGRCSFEDCACADGPVRTPVINDPQMTRFTKTGANAKRLIMHQILTPPALAGAHTDRDAVRP